ncbi:MAG: TIR domain-containing protein [Candidatus Desantisbacteria bacterium]
MPTLKNRMIFISHAWSYNQHYWTLVHWFNEESNFSWSNCSVPSHDALPDKTSKGLSEGMTRQISPAQVVVILGGMYASYSAWIDYEISEAKRMNKVIIGVKPWGQERVPLSVQNASICPVVGWNRSSIIQAIRLYS